MATNLQKLKTKLLKPQIHYDAPVVEPTKEELPEFKARFSCTHKNMNCLLNSGNRVLFTEFEAVVTDRFIANELSHQFAQHIKRTE